MQMVESASKGMILMYAKEAILKVLNKSEVSPGIYLDSPAQHAWELADAYKITNTLMPR